MPYCPIRTIILYSHPPVEFGYHKISKFLLPQSNRPHGEFICALAVKNPPQILGDFVSYLGSRIISYSRNPESSLSLLVIQVVCMSPTMAAGEASILASLCLANGPSASMMRTKTIPMHSTLASFDYATFPVASAMGNTIFTPSLSVFLASVVTANLVVSLTQASAPVESIATVYLASRQ
jgi:hypothetical protein